MADHTTAILANVQQGVGLARVNPIGLSLAGVEVAEAILGHRQLENRHVLAMSRHTYSATSPSGLLLGGTEGQEWARAAMVRHVEQARLAALSRTDLSALTKKLAKIDARFRNKVEGVLGHAMRAAQSKALRKAGVRARKASDAKMAAVQADWKAQRLTPAVLAAIATTDEELLDESFSDAADEIGDLYDARQLSMRQALAQALAVANAEGGDPNEIFDELTSRWQITEQQRRDLLVWFTTTAMFGEARARLQSGVTGDDLYDDEGEVPFDTSVPSTVVSSILKIANGAAVTAAGVVLVGAALGANPLDAFADDLVEGAIDDYLPPPEDQPVDQSGRTWEWTTGDPKRPFEPHQELDGLVFTDDDIADVLGKDPEEFPYGNTTWFPSDHVGCECSVQRVWGDNTALAASVRASIAPEDIVRDSIGRFATKGGGDGASTGLDGTRRLRESESDAQPSALKNEVMTNVAKAIDPKAALDMLMSQTYDAPLGGWSADGEGRSVLLGDRLRVDGRILEASAQSIGSGHAERISVPDGESLVAREIRSGNSVDGVYLYTYLLSMPGPRDDGPTDFPTAGTPGFNQAITEGIAAAAVDSWTKSSNDPFASVLNDAAAEKFGLTPDTTRITGYQPADRPGWYTPEVATVGRQIADKMYADTQAWFRDKGVDRVTLFRGMILPADQVPDRDTVGVVRSDLKMNSLSAYSWQFGTARIFAGSDPHNENLIGAVVATTVPASQVFSTPHTGIGSYDEAEAVVIGQPSPAALTSDSWIRGQMLDGMGSGSLSQRGDAVAATMLNQAHVATIAASVTIGVDDDPANEDWIRTLAAERQASGSPVDATTKALTDMAASLGITADGWTEELHPRDHGKFATKEGAPRSFATREAASQWIDEQRAAIPSTPEQQDSLVGYQMKGWYGDINNTLRDTGEPLYHLDAQGVKDQTAILDSVIAASRDAGGIPESVVATRSIVPTPETAGLVGAFTDGSAVGWHITDPGFTSTSLHTDAPDPSYPDWNLHMTVPAGTPAMFPPTDNFAFETEMILGRNTTYRIDSVDPASKSVNVTVTP